MSLRNKTITGVKWTSVSTITLAVVGLVKISVLARYLDASDFGLMALVTFVLGFMNLFMDMGLTSAILHKQNISDNEYASLYWINVIFSLILFGLISLGSPYIAGFYKESELTILIPLMAISIMLSAFGRQFKTIEQKDLNFKYIAATDILGAAFGLVIGVLLAIWGYGVYALVYAALTQYAISNLIYFVKGFIDRGMFFHFNYDETKPFIMIGIYQVGGQVVNYFNRDLDILLIGKFFGSEILGGYSLAKQLVQKPMQILNPIITKVASPVLSLLQSDRVKLKDKFLSFLNIVATANFTAYGLLAILAYPVVLLLYGNDFTHIVILVQILSAYMFIRSVASPVGSLVVATGRTDLEFYWNFYVLLIIPISIYIGSLYSITVVASNLSITMLLLLAPFWKLLIQKLCGADFKEFILNVLPNYKATFNKIIK
ncbi:MAG: MOP flippase family protein [Candidatus Woykebacteria bacterium]